MTRILLLSVAALSLSACGSAIYQGVGPDGELPVIASANDTGVDRAGLSRLRPAVAYDPDGCQVWLFDNGVEGYSARRRDPATGLPVCDQAYPPGTVVGEYRTNWVPDLIQRPR